MSAITLPGATAASTAATTPDLLAALAADQPAAPPRPNTHNKGRRFSPDPPSVEDIVTVLNHCTPQTTGAEGVLSAARLRAHIAFVWRTGLRCAESLDLEQRDLIPQDMAVVVRNGKGGKRRVVAMDEWGWNELRTWLELRHHLPPGPVFPVVRGRTAGSRWHDSDVRHQYRLIGQRAGLHRRFHPHGLRHACAVELWREGISELVIQRQLGHVRLDVTSLYLRSLAPVEVLEPIGKRRPPMMLIAAAVHH